MMCRYRTLLCAVFVMVVLKSASSTFIKSVAGETGIAAVRKAPRFSWAWFMADCNGCPPHTCEDDEAIIHGYCCGCAYSLDQLPVMCPQFLMCPLNLHGLCHDYEYMMRCCC